MMRFRLNRKPQATEVQNQMGLAPISFGTTIRSLSNTIREPRGVELDEWKRRAGDSLSGDNSISGF